jgi:hypothetical protein
MTRYIFFLGKEDRHKSMYDLLLTLCIYNRYFPFPYTQRITHHNKCDDEGELVMFELPSAVLQPGARGWVDVLMLDERIGLMRLFIFLLQAACDCNATVAIETVVNGRDFKEINKGKLTGDTVVTAYRLWIPLDAAAQVQYLTAIAGTLCTRQLADMVNAR